MLQAGLYKAKFSRRVCELEISLLNLLIFNFAMLVTFQEYNSHRFLTIKTKITIKTIKTHKAGTLNLFKVQPMATVKTPTITPSRNLSRQTFFAVWFWYLFSLLFEHHSIDLRHLQAKFLYKNRSVFINLPSRSKFYKSSKIPYIKYPIIAKHIVIVANQPIPTLLA